MGEKGVRVASFEDVARAKWKMQADTLEKAYDAKLDQVQHGQAREATKRAEERGTAII